MLRWALEQSAYLKRRRTFAIKVRTWAGSAGVVKLTSAVPAKNSRICSIVASLESFICITIPIWSIQTRHFESPIPLETQLPFQSLMPLDKAFS
jgi:hypothetical protein